MPDPLETRQRARRSRPIEPPPERWEQRVEVRFEYPVVFTHGMFEAGNDALAWCLARAGAGRHRAFFVVDDGVARAWPGIAWTIASYAATHDDVLELVGTPLVVPGGEAVKNDPQIVASLQDRFGALRLDRHAFVVIVGGGAVLDAVGYAAATTHRGLRVIRAPTTVLAQNDAGIGVKNGVNARGIKNYLGTFAPPHAVVNDDAWLTTLHARDRRAGIAEAVKVGLIRDTAFFEWIERNADALAAFEPVATHTMIRRCAELHLDHIRSGGDPFESGSKRPLDFGHWAAHKLERMSAHALRHGEAVAIGIALDVCYAARTGLLAPELAVRVCESLERLGLPIFHPCLEERDEGGRLRVADGLEEFREHLGGSLTVTALQAIGRACEIHAVDLDVIDACVRWLAQRPGASASRLRSVVPG